jgi:signal transduction histidine kinase
MLSLNNNCQKTAPAAAPSPLAAVQSEPPPLGLENQIGREVAHDLNNILTIIQGYADRIILKHGENLALRSDLQLISDNARRAVTVIRQARPRKPLA